MKWMRNVACMEDRRGAHRDLVKKSEGRWLLGGTRPRLGDNVKMDLQKFEWTAWIGLIW